MKLLYPMPLTPEDRDDLFQTWLEANGEAWDEIEFNALSIHQRGKRVSAKYLIEKQRYEGTARLVAVPFLDAYGNTHRYAINNSDTPRIARTLLKKYPYLKIQVRDSEVDHV